MNLPIEEKLEFVAGILDGFRSGFDVVPMREHAASAAKRDLAERVCGTSA